MTIEYGRIAAVRPADTSEQLLYQVPALTEINAPLRICNQTNADQTYSVAHTAVAGAAQPEDWLARERIVPAGETDELSIHAKTGEQIRVQAGAADALSFHLSGQQIVKEAG